MLTALMLSLVLALTAGQPCDLRNSLCGDGLICQTPVSDNPLAGMSEPICVKNTSTACPEDAMACPGGGAFVTRVGPNCEFAPCPENPRPVYTPIPLPVSPGNPAACGWCGNVCTRLMPNLDCNKSKPFTGQACIEMKGECRVTNMGLKITRPGDLTGDDTINIFDYNIFVARFVSKDTSIDINEDGKVNIFDYNILVANYGR